jgi:SRSO17 transposase
VPREIAFETKPQIALNQYTPGDRRQRAEAVTLADAGYGNDMAFRDAQTEIRCGSS